MGKFDVVHSIICGVISGQSHCQGVRKFLKKSFEMTSAHVTGVLDLTFLDIKEEIGRKSECQLLIRYEWLHAAFSDTFVTCMCSFASYLD